MQRENIVERDFMGLTDPNAIANPGSEDLGNHKDEGMAGSCLIDLKTRERLPTLSDDLRTLKKDINIASSVETGNNNSEANGAVSRHFGLSLAAGSVDGLSALAHPIEGTGDFPSSNLSLSMSNFREHFGSPLLLNGQQATVTSCTSSMVKPFAGSHFAGQYSFPPAAVGIYAGSTTSRATSNVPEKPAGAQLTIFYAGTVNVYDDVPPEKAQGLMLLAGSGRSAKMTNQPPRSSTISSAMVSSGYSMPTPSLFCSTLPSPVFPATPQVPLQKPQVSIQASQSTTVSPSAGDAKINQNIVPPSNQQEAPKSSAMGITPAPIVPRAVPQARKASLARFLEKRKERVQTKVPYPTKKSPDGSPQRDKSLSPNHCSTHLPLDGCLPKQHMLTGNGLDEKLLTNSEGIVSCLERDQEEHSWSLKPRKTEKEETETAVEVASA